MAPIVISVPHPSQEFKLILSDDGEWSVDPETDDTLEMMGSIEELSCTFSTSYIFFNRSDLEELAEEIVLNLRRIIPRSEIIEW